MITPAESAAATVDDVLVTPELDRRPARAADHAGENRALLEFAEVMAESPKRIFQKLADAALELCRAGSAGISVWEPGDADVFRWRATAGAYARYVGNTLPRDFSPCGEVIDRRATLLMADPERAYPYISELCAPAREVLLVPFYQGETAVGTVWVVSHTADRRFDAEDARLVKNLARFAGAAVQSLSRIEGAEHAEEVRQDVQNRLESTLSAGEVATWTWDVGADRVVADRNLADLFGVSDADAHGGPIAGYIASIHPDDRGPTGELIRLSMKTGEAYEARYRVRHADGEYRTVVARGKPEYDASGAVTRLPGVVVDVTRQARAEAALRASEDRRRLALDAAELGSWNVDPASMTLTTDERFRAIFGVVAEALDYEAAVARIHPDDRDRVREAVASAIRPDDPVPYGIEYRIARPDGGVRWVHAKGRTNFEGTGAERRMVSFDGTLADVTEPKRVGDALRQFAADLSDADRRKDEFLATLAHELRNPLAPIRNGLQVLTMSDRPEARERAVAMMGRQLGQMVRLVDDLMDVSRVSRGKLDLKRERVPLADVLASAVETSRPLIDQMGHELTCTPPDRDIVVDADLTRLAQVFLNLLNNAAKYMDRGGRIWLTAKRIGNEVVVSVRDAGVGIATDQLPRIFDLFSQVDRSLEKAQGGLGIGLTLVRRLTEMHGGTIEARSDGPGRGSEFVVRLPAVDAPASSGTGRHEERPTPTARRILIVDDDRDGADSLSEMMAILGNATRTAYDGEAAVAVAAEFGPEVILLDIGLPKLNGYEACRRIRAQGRGTRPLIVAQTGWGADEDRRRTREAGFDHHLVKPVEPLALMRLLAEALAPR